MGVKVIKFSAVWCAPCRALKPIWDNLENDPSLSGVQFLAVDIDDHPEMAQQYDVRAVPTIIFIKDDVVVDSLVGLYKEADIRSKLESWN